MVVIRAIRDYFSPDIGEILIDTDDIYEQAKTFMSLVMPDTEGRVKRYRDDVPLFSRFQIEHQIESAYSRTVQLPSGGAIVIDHTEALVAIDVNSARSTRGSDIEETAFRTNMEAAEEAARQLRLRDMGGLIVIDFIDMESARNQRDVEQKLKDAMKPDRARVQMGKISRFGLMELSRQRLRPALAEASHTVCPRCNGTGHIRDTESSALHILRMVQEEAMKDNTATVRAQVPVDVATFLLNEKRLEINRIEARQRVNVLLIPNIHLETPHHTIERLRFDDQTDTSKPSFEQVDAPDAEGYKRKEPGAQIKKPEPAVKGITPEAPAPMRAAEPEAAPAPAAEPAAASTLSAPAGDSGGIIGRIMGWFKPRAEPVRAVEASSTTTAEVSTATPPARERSDGGNRNGRGGRNGRGRGGERGERSDRPERGERTERGDRPPRGPRPERDGQRGERRREPTDGAKPEAAETEVTANAEGQRPERGERGNGRRRERNPRQDGDSAPIEPRVDSLAATGEASATVDTGDAGTPPGAERPDGEGARDGEGRRGRGRRGRRGRGRSGERDGEGENAAAEGAEAGDSTAAEGSAAAMPAAPMVEAVPAAAAPADTAPTVAAVAAVAAAEPVATAEPAAVVDTPAAVPVPVVPVAAAEVATPAVIVPAPAIAAPVPPVAAEPIRIRKSAAEIEAERMAMLTSAGLALVETDSQKWRAAYDRASQLVEPVQPKRVLRAQPPLEQGPLVQVETSRR